MNRQEAERIYNSGREAVIEKLLSFAAHIRKLEQNINALTRNSSNSSRPPSSDPPGTKKTKTKKTKSTQKQGGQPGHKGKNRKLLPVEEMDKIHDIYPEKCEHCHNPLSATLINPFAKPVRHQVFDLPVIVPFKEEYRCHSLLCQCGHSTAASLPEHVAHSNFGPQTHSSIAYLASVHRVTRRGIAEIMQTLFGIAISTGAVCNAAKRVSNACLPMVGAIKQYVASALTLNIDETGWKNQGETRYLWTFVAPKAVLFHVSREQLLLATLPTREKMYDFCIIFRYSTDPKVQTRTRRLLDNWQHLFTFLEYQGVQPTNNAAERAIRPAVRWRKICFGSQSEIGEQFTGRLLTVGRTCQLHGINFFEFLTKLVKASFSAKQHLPALPLSLPN